MLSTCNDNPLMSDCHSSIGEWTVLVVFWLQIEVTDVPFTHICSPAITTESLEHLSPSVVINGLQCCVAIWAQSSKLNMTIFVGANNGLENSFVRTWHEHSLSCRRSIWLEFYINAPHSTHADGMWEQQIKNCIFIVKTKDIKGMHLWVMFRRCSFKLADLDTVCRMHSHLPLKST